MGSVGAAGADAAASDLIKDAAVRLDQSYSRFCRSCLNVWVK